MGSGMSVLPREANGFVVTKKLMLKGKASEAHALSDLQQIMYL